jgi:hypothetical protein
MMGVFGNVITFDGVRWMAEHFAGLGWLARIDE